MEGSNGTIAFALGGLAGNNAFGAGVLQAALDCQVKPDFISCTSGQISWTLSYLNALEGGASLEKVLEDEIKEQEPYPLKDMNWMNLMTTGLKDVYKPVSPVGYMTEMSLNMVNSFKDISQDVAQGNFKSISWIETIQRWKPSRTLKPARTDDVFDLISTAFNRSDIGIAFNSYAPLKGEEYVYLNGKAWEALGITEEGQSGYRLRTYYFKITPDSVKDALWLYQYGFPEGITTIDGAYYRQIMLSELVGADKIFVVRPVNHEWLSKLPVSDVGAQDLQTELLFNGSYIGERDKIALINTLIAEGKLSSAEFRPIELVELEIPTQQGFFDYVFEKPSVFNDAKKMAIKQFRALGLA